MARKLAPDELRLWSHVAATVRPAPGKTVPKAPAGTTTEAAALPPRLATAQRAAPLSAPGRRAASPDPIEPNRKRRLTKGLAPLEGVLDLHGHDQDQAERALRGFLMHSYNEGRRAVLVITGRGVRGGGVLRQRAPEWLSAAGLREIVAGFSPSHQKHGGEGALYVALKRKAVG